ncbi:hypothetical protein JZ751_002740 [Albula glossodonta]|uniref:A-kinase anchor protein 6 n=1 Tax=Albula glossodonta TaxID=121402 RepID=A0A8T2N7S6_9TELE|nr:hypothetical protein JZ751_002740 [Albula glossodonta]
MSEEINRKDVRSGLREGDSVEALGQQSIMESSQIITFLSLEIHLGNSVEMAMWLPKKTQLLGRAESLRRSGAALPPDFEERITALTCKWDQLQGILGEHMEVPGPGSPAHDPRALLSPETNSMLGQLQCRIKELKAWLRDTELFIFNSCLLKEHEQDAQAHKQLQYFKKLLEEQDSCEPESERQALQLLTVNLQRRWEAIVMQALQWQTRLQRALGTEQVPGNVIESSFMNLHSPPEDSWEWDETDISNDLISVGMESSNLEEQHSHTCKSATGSPGCCSDVRELSQSVPSAQGPPSLHSSGLTPPSLHPSTYQVYSLRDMELYDRPQYPLHKKALTKAGGKQPLMKSLSKDSSFCSAESLPDLFGGILYGKEGQGRSSGDSTRRSESESGIVSEGDTENTGNSEICALRLAGDGSAGSVSSTPPPDGVESPTVGRICDKDIDRLLERAEKFAVYGSCSDRPAPDGKQRPKVAKKKRDESTERKRRCRRDPVEIVINGHYSLLESEGEEFDPGAFRAVKDDKTDATARKGGKGLACTSQGSSLDSLFTAGELFTSSKDALHRSTSLESWLAPSAPSLTELSSSEDSSVGSEDMAVQRNCLVDSNASFRKHCRSHAPPQDEADASVSMVVNVSCTSACTDDEDDSDLLSSSTLTLTEEELGIKEDGDSSLASDEEYIEGGFALGLEYMKNELQNWIKPRSQSRDKSELDLGDELQCGTTSRENAPPTTAATSANEKRFLSRSALKLLESNANGKNSSLQQQQQQQAREGTRSSMSQFVDDLENGNVENSLIKAKDEDDELLREEGGLFTKSGESFKDRYAQDSPSSSSGGVVRDIKPSMCDLLSLQPKECALEGQLSGEIPCHSSRRQSPLASPANGCAASPESSLGPERGTHSQNHLTSFLKDTHETVKQAANPGPPCCTHSSQPPPEEEEEEGEDVHNFVMEIIDMASVVLKNKESRADQETTSSAPVTQIRDKVLEHSHRPIHLRKGDFYSYLSLSSHDSDCGEVSTCAEDKSSTPLPYDVSDTPDIHDEERLFQPCTEEVYLGPPLCYSMCMTKRKNLKSRICPSPKIIKDGAPPSPRPERGSAADDQGPQGRGLTSDSTTTCASRSRYAMRESGTARPLAKFQVPAMIGDNGSSCPIPPPPCGCGSPPWHVAHTGLVLWLLLLLRLAALSLPSALMMSSKWPTPTPNHPLSIMDPRTELPQWSATILTPLPPPHVSHSLSIFLSLSLSLCPFYSFLSLPSLTGMAVHYLTISQHCQGDEAVYFRDVTQYRERLNQWNVQNANIAVSMETANVKGRGAEGSSVNIMADLGRGTITEHSLSSFP